MDRLTTEYIGFHTPKEMCTFNILGEADDGYTCTEMCTKNEGDCPECCIQKAFTRLGEYEDAEEQGLLWKLPCKVGDYVYQLDRILWKIHTRKVSKIELAVTATDSVMTIYFETAGFCYLSHFGKTVFLDKKDALNALDPYSVG